MSSRPHSLHTLDDRRSGVPVTRQPVAADGRATAGTVDPVSTRPGIVTAPMVLPGDEPVIYGEDMTSRAAEQYRILRTSLRHHPAKPKVIVFSSGGPGDGKTLTAVNVAGFLSLKQDATTVLVDADLRMARIGKMLGIPETKGLAGLLRGECGLDEALVQIQQSPNLFVLQAGEGQSTPTELLDSPLWGLLVEQLRSRFQFVVIDTTPIAAFADFDLVMSAADAAVMVVRPDHTDRAMFRKSLESIPKEKLLGLVVNGAQQWVLWKTHDHYYGYSGYAKNRDK